MKLQTTIPLKIQGPSIDYASKLVLLGSCFSQNIGDKLAYFKFQQTSNPFGVIFHPVAIEKLLERAVRGTFFSEKDIFFHNEQWHCFDVHSALSRPDKQNFLDTLNTQLSVLRNSLETASHIVLTFGTAWVYRQKETASVVANCHKVPQAAFLKELLSVEQISESIINSIQYIKELNANATIIATLSPVRHLKDGFTENARSKAHLLAGIHHIVDTAALHYFPSFEIMMDELRDYRFYDEDLIHPNNTAIRIIWEKFKEVWIASETKETQKEIALIQRGLQHRPFFPESESHKVFSEGLQKKIKVITERFPHIKFTV